MRCRLHFLPSVFWLGLSFSRREGMIWIQVCSLINSKLQQAHADWDYFFVGITLRGKVSHNIQYWIRNPPLQDWSYEVPTCNHKFIDYTIKNVFYTKHKKGKKVGTIHACWLFLIFFWEKKCPCICMKQNLLNTQLTKMCLIKETSLSLFPPLFLPFHRLFSLVRPLWQIKPFHAHFLSCKIMTKFSIH